MDLDGAGGRREGADKVRSALAAASPTDKDTAAALTLCGWFEASGGNLERAVSDLEDAIRIGDDQAGAVARLYLAFVHTQAGRAKDALALLEGCRADLARFGLPWEEGASWLLSAWAHIASGDTVAGRAASDQAFTRLRPLGDNWALGHAEGLLGELAQAQGRYVEATAHLAGAAHAAGTLGFEAAQAHHLLNLGRAQQQAGDLAASRATLEEAIDTGQRCGDARTVAFARTRLAQVLRNTGETAMALHAVSRAVDWFMAAGGGDGALLADYLLAALHTDEDAPAAREELAAVLERTRAAADPVVEVLTLDALAALNAREGNPEIARSQIAAADAIATATPFLWPGDRVDRERSGRE